MKSLLISLTLLVAVFPQLPPRDAPARPMFGTAAIGGVVLTGVDNPTPVRRARVMLNSSDGLVEPRTATTNDEGRFEFRDLPAGRFTIDVQKPGYLSGSYGAARPGRAGSAVSVADGARAVDLTIRMSRGAAIMGTVRDQRGRPIVGVNVSALRFGYSLFGERTLSTFGSTAPTDDRGVFRIWGLPGGEYLVRASPLIPRRYGEGADSFDRLTAAEVDRVLSAARGSGNTAGSEVSPRSTTNDLPTANYAPVFHPGSPDAAQAATIVLADGEERSGIDIAVSLVPTARVSGVVRMPDGSAPPRSTISQWITGDGVIEGLRNVMRQEFSSTDAEGRFAFEDLAPGRYSISVKTNPTSPPVMWASATVQANGAPVELQLTLAPAMTVTGRVEFEGSSQPPEPTMLNVRLVAPGGGPLNNGPTGGEVKSDRTFAFTGATPDRYWMIETFRSSWRGWWLKSAVANGQDVYETRLRVSSGENLEMVLTYTDRPSEITGVFQDASGRPAPDYFIVAFPVDRTLWSSLRRLRSTRPATDGHYSIQGLRGGEYFIAALTDFQSEDLYAPSFLTELSATAGRVTIVDGQVTRQDLKIGRQSAPQSFVNSRVTNSR